MKTPGFVLAAGIRVADRARISPYRRLELFRVAAPTRRVHLPRRPFIRTKNNVTSKAEYPDYIFAAMADLEMTR